jgi:hypothetical protein
MFCFLTGKPQTNNAKFKKNGHNYAAQALARTRLRNTNQWFFAQGFEFDVGIHYVGELELSSLARTFIDQITQGEINVPSPHPLIYLVPAFAGIC